MMLLYKPIYVTEKGLAKLEEELEHLRTVKRPRTIERLQESKGNGDWMEDAEHMLFEDELAFIDSRIQELEHMLRHAELIEPGRDESVVEIGDTVVIQTDGELEKYTIVGIAESDPGRGFISNESPLGRALLDHAVGDEVVVQAPAGPLHYRIVAVT